MKTKKCKRCVEEKQLEEFDFSNKPKNYRKSFCRPCSLEIYNEWRTKNSEHSKQQRHEYYLKNKDKFNKK